MPVTIRPIKIEDATAYAELFNQLLGETKFLLFEPGERNFTAELFHRLIQEMLEEDEQMVFVAEEQQLVGFLRIIGETPRRLQHSAKIVIAIRQAYTGQGIGTRLFEVMEAWAQARNLHRLWLTVMTHNERGIALYKKMGFVLEGTHRHSLKIDGEYVDEYTMAKLI